MNTINILAIALFGAAIGCDSTGIDSAGATSSSGGVASECAGPLVKARLAGIGVSDAGCVDNTMVDSVDVCVDPSTDAHNRYYCLRRASDDKEVWIGHSREVYPASTDWDYCDPSVAHQEIYPPPPCFAASCPATGSWGERGMATSTCSEEETHASLQCGVGDSEWDESCCHRRACGGDFGDCPAGQECRLGGGIGYFDLVATYDPLHPERLTCNSSGTLGGAQTPLCFTIHP